MEEASGFIAGGTIFAGLLAIFAGLLTIAAAYVAFFLMGLMPRILAGEVRVKTVLLTLLLPELAALPVSRAFFGTCLVERKRWRLASSRFCFSASFSAAFRSSSRRAFSRLASSAACLTSRLPLALLSLAWAI